MVGCLLGSLRDPLRVDLGSEEERSVGNKETRFECQVVVCFAPPYNFPADETGWKW